jgi:hypothetical protein
MREAGVEKESRRERERALRLGVLPYQTLPRFFTDVENGCVSLEADEGCTFNYSSMINIKRDYFNDILLGMHYSSIILFYPFK